VFEILKETNHAQDQRTLESFDLISLDDDPGFKPVDLGFQIAFAFPKKLDPSIGTFTAHFVNQTRSTDNKIKKKF